VKDMDKNLTQEERKKIYNVLFDNYIKGIQLLGLNRSQRKSLSQDILDNIEKAKTFQEIYIFLDSTAKTYNFFGPVLLTLKDRLYKEKEEKVITKLQDYIKSYDKKVL
jgi:hypothetical protein